jgi:lipopolysaccharide biosynthesis glycosyltransferase
MVTLAIGDKYLKQYNSLFRPSNEYYAAKHGYDFRVITEYIDPTLQDPKSVTIHKYLLCSQEWSSQYDYIVVIDADILINKNSPPIPFEILGDKVGMVDEACQPTTEKRIEVNRHMGWQLTPKEYFALCDFELDSPHLYNSGVVVYQPKKHRDFLENVYKTYSRKSVGHPRGTHFEQTVTNYCFQSANMVCTLPYIFNTPWILYELSDPSFNLDTFYESNCFVHFVAIHGYEHVKRLWEKST